MSIFHPTHFFTTVADLRDLPQGLLPEIAFAGRSNAGKSTVINVLTNQRRLAYASKTPGRTQHLNYFSVVKQQNTIGYLVDLPGYGFADMPLKAKEHWNYLIGEYVRKREPLAGLIVIMDSRRPFTDLDHQMVQWVLPTQKPIHILLNKSDKLNRSECAMAKRKATEILKEYGEHTSAKLSLQLFSASKKIGLDELETVLKTWLNLLPTTLDIETPTDPTA